MNEPRKSAYSGLSLLREIKSLRWRGASLAAMSGLRRRRPRIKAADARNVSNCGVGKARGFRSGSGTAELKLVA